MGKQIYHIQSCFSSAENRLCWLGPRNPDVPDSIEVDPQVEGAQFVLRQESKFYTDTMHRMEDLNGPKPSASFYKQLVDEAEWQRQFLLDPERPNSNAGKEQVVEYVWQNSNKAEQLELFRTYALEHLGGKFASTPLFAELGKAEAKFNAATTDKEKMDAQKDIQLVVQKIMILRIAQQYGEKNIFKLKKVLPAEIDSRLVDNMNQEKVFALIEVGLHEKFTTSKGVNVAAYDDFLDIADMDEDLRTQIFGIQNFTPAELQTLKNALPPSSLRGALSLGLISDADLQKMIEIYKKREDEHATAKRVAHQSQNRLQTKIKNNAETMKQLGIADSEYFSDRLKAGWSSLGSGSKLLLGAAGLAIGIKLITDLFRKDTGKIWKLFSVGTLAAAGYFLGGDRLLGKMVGEKFMPGSIMKNATDRIRGVQPDTQREYLASFMEHMNIHLAEHGEDTPLYELSDAAVLGRMPLSMISESYRPWEDGKEGILDLRENHKQFLIKELGPSAATVINRVTRGGNMWSKPLAHVFYLYGIHKAPDARQNQKLHIEKIAPHLQQTALDSIDEHPLSLVNNFDAIKNQKARLAYDTIVERGIVAARNSEMTLADFIVSLNRIPADSEEIPGLPNDDFGTGLPNDDFGTGFPKEDTETGLPNEKAGTGLPNEKAGTGLPNEKTGTKIPDERLGRKLPKKESTGTGLPDEEGPGTQADDVGTGLPKEEAPGAKAPEPTPKKKTSDPNAPPLDHPGAPKVKRKEAP